MTTQPSAISVEMDAFYQAHGPLVHTAHSRHMAIANRARGPRVLDYGCGTGDLLCILQEYEVDWKLVGIDASLVALRMAEERGLRAELWRAEQPPETGAYETIVAAQVIEHVEDDAGLLAGLARLLAPTGRLIVSVPREDRLPAPDHKRTYNEDTLLTLLAPIGAARIDNAWPGWRDRILAMVDKQTRQSSIGGKCNGSSGTKDG